MLQADLISKHTGTLLGYSQTLFKYSDTVWGHAPKMLRANNRLEHGGGRPQSNGNISLRDKKKK